MARPIFGGRLLTRESWPETRRVTDILRDEALLPLYRKAGLIHVSLGTEAAAQPLQWPSHHTPLYTW